MQEETHATIPMPPFTAAGVEWTVTFSMSTKRFHATAPGFRAVMAPSYDELISYARRLGAIARVKVDVPYAYLAGNRQAVVAGVAHGVHMGTGNILAYENGRARQLTNPVLGFFRPMSAADQARYLQLIARIDQLDREAKELAGTYAFPSGSLGQQVSHEVEQARLAQEQDG